MSGFFVLLLSDFLQIDSFAFICPSRIGSPSLVVLISVVPAPLSFDYMIGILRSLSTPFFFALEIGCVQHIGSHASLLLVLLQ